MPGTDHQRFNALIEPHLDAMFRAAYRLTRNRDDAQDLVQETCVRACEHLDRLQDSASAKPWLLKVMHNRFVDGARRANSSPVAAFDEGADVEASICPGPTPEESLESRQRLAQLERAWLMVEPGHRALLALRAEGYTLAEISGITSIAMDALTMRLYRARQNLTRCLQQQRPESSPVFMEAVK